MEIWFHSKRTKVMLSWDKTELEIFLPHFPFIREDDNFRKTTPILSVMNSIYALQYRFGHLHTESSSISEDVQNLVQPS